MFITTYSSDLASRIEVQAENIVSFTPSTARG